MPRRKDPSEFAEDRPIYDRQPWESDRQWFLFKSYRDLESARSYKRLNKIYSAKYNTKMKDPSFAVWSTKQSITGRWKERCAEWDRVLDAEVRNQRLKAIEDMQARHLEMAFEASAAAMFGLEAIKNAAELARNKGEEHLSVKEVLDLASFGIATERTTKGEPTQIQEQRHKVDVNDKREILQKLAKNPDLFNSLLDTIDEDEEE